MFDGLLSGLMPFVDLGEYAIQRELDVAASRKYNEEVAIPNWQMQNEYNLPANQLQRYTEAGMSPATAMDAIKGGSSVAGPTTASMSSGASSSVGQRLLGLENLMLDKRVADANIRNTEADTEKKEAETERINFITPLEGQNLIKDFDVKTSAVNLNNAQAQWFRTQEWRMVQMTPAELKKIQNETDEIQEKIRLWQAQTKTEEFQQKYLESASKLNEARTVTEGDLQNLYKSESYVNNGKGQLIMYDLMKADFDNYVRETLHADPTDGVWSSVWQAIAHGRDGAMNILTKTSDFAGTTLAAIDKSAPWLKYGLAARWALKNSTKHNAYAIDRFSKVVPFGKYMPLGLFEGSSFIEPDYRNIFYPSRSKLSRHYIDDDLIPSFYD